MLVNTMSNSCTALENRDYPYSVRVIIAKDHIFSKTCFASLANHENDPPEKVYREDYYKQSDPLVSPRFPLFCPK